MFFRIIAYLCENYPYMIRYFEDIEIADRNSFHVRQRAARLAEFDRAEELPELFARYTPQQWLALGGGNNILFTRDVEPMLIVPCDKRIEVIESNGDRTLVRAGAGVEWDDLVAWSVERELWGIENLSLIPGKVGAAPVQNIGAYGAEAKDAIVSVELYEPATGEFRTLSAAECHFGYRESIFKHEAKGRVIITSVCFELSHTPAPRLGYGDVMREVEARGGVSLRNIREAICSIRRSKLPDTAVLGNAGSFFKNPIVENCVAKALLAKYPDMPTYPSGHEGMTKLAAGWLIDRAGMKGYREGCVGVHDRQALVLVNLGGATGGEVMELARTVQQRVREAFGIDIDTEVNIL